MLAFLEKIVVGFWTTCQRIFALIFPFVSSAQWLRKLGGGLLWTLRLLLLIGGFIGLWLINRYLIPSTWILAPHKYLQDWWLPTLGVLAYLLVVIGLWLVRLLGPEAEKVEFEDIKQAWEQAQHALNKAGIDLTEAPLFLVLGRPLSGDDALFEGAKLEFAVRHAPPDAGAPLYVYGNRDGVYVACAGASLLGRQAAILAGQPGIAPAGGLNQGITPAVAGGDDIFKTLTPQGRLKDVQAILGRAREQGRNPDQLTEQEQQEIRVLMTQENIEYAQQQASKPRPLLTKNPEEVRLLSARLHYLCRLIVRDRQPYCPLNGILVAMPFAATDSREDADQTGAILQQDLTTVRKSLQVQCPVFALVCDLETAKGFATFLERFPVDQRQRRVGQRYPLIPDLTEGQSPVESLDKSVQWISSALIPTHIYRLFRVETPGREEAGSTTAGNIRLYTLLGQLRERQKRLSGVLVRGLAPDQEEPYLFGGCYLAATGAGPNGAQAFLPGVFRRLIENQSFVAWTAAGKKEEEGYKRWARYGYVALAGAGLVLVLIAAILWYRS